MHVHHGSLQLLVVQVVHVADQQGHFVGGCQDGRRRRWGRRGTLLLSLLPSAHRGDTPLWLVSLSPSTRVPHGAPWPSGASWGDTGDGHNPTGPPTPPGQALTIQLAGATTLRGAWKERNTMPRPHSAWGAQRAERQGPARSAPTYLHPPPARSLQRRRAAGLRQRGESGSPMCSSISQHRLESPKTAGQPQEGFGQGGQSGARIPHVGWGGHGGLSRALTDLHVHFPAPDLVEEVEHTAGVAAPLGRRHQLHLPAGQRKWLGRCVVLFSAAPCRAVPCRALQGVPRYLELGCLRTLHGAPVPEPLILGRGVADGCALQRQCVPLGQAARPRLPQDLQPCHGRAVTAGWGGDGVENLVPSHSRALQSCSWAPGPSLAGPGTHGWHEPAGTRMTQGIRLLRGHRHPNKPTDPHG